MKPNPRNISRGFTIIELLVVIGILTILGSLLIVGINFMSRSAKGNATKTDLQNVSAMFDELKATGGMNRAPSQWLWRNLQSPSFLVFDPANPAPYNAAPYASPIKSIDFWNVPLLTSSAIPDCLDAQGSLVDDNSSPADPTMAPSLSKNMRNGSRAVLNTQLAMRIMLAYPANKTAVSKLPADRLFVPEWVYGQVPGTGANGIFDASDSGDDIIYAVNNCVKYQGGTFRCIVAHKAQSGNGPPMPNATGDANNANWQQDSGATPLILDAWNNPIIFVPASGLINVYGNVGVSQPFGVGTTTTVATDANHTVAALPGTANPPASGGRYITPIQSPDNRPFFVSAGPDGNLLTGDDNIYSFEK